LKKYFLGNCRILFGHIHRHKAASRHRPVMAVNCRSHYIKINASYREAHASAADPYPDKESTVHSSIGILD
jgi:hypothetical protein